MTKRFKNGNINVKLDADTIARWRKGLLHAMETLLNELENVDTYMIGEEFNLGNSAVGITVYSYYADKCYTVNLDSDLDTILDGKTLKLYARDPDENDREILESEAE